jgi:hypothetical protein
MKTTTLLTGCSVMALSLLALAGIFVTSSFAQQNMTNMTTATNQTGAMAGNQTNQTGGNQTQQGGPLEQLGKTLGGIFGGGNKSQ